MVGEVIGTGGVALKSDLIQKKLEFFRNLAEHVQLIGDRKIVSGSVQASATNVLYTVPRNKLYFIVSATLDDRNINAGNAAVWLAIEGSGNLIRMPSVNGHTDSKIIVFSPPIVLKVGEVLVLAKNNVHVGMECNCSIVGYEVPAEIGG